MFKSFSIKAKLLFIVIGAILVVSITIMTESILALKHESKLTLKEFRENAYRYKKEEVKNYISLTMKTIESYYQRSSSDKIKNEVQDYLKEQTNFMYSIMEGTYNKYKNVLSDAELKDLIKNQVSATRYGKTGYFWINDTDANMVMHAIKSSLDGKNLSQTKDKNGKRLFWEFAQVAKKQNEGFVDYVWPKPGFETPQLKVSFVKLFKPYNWVIGTGEYVSDVTSKLQKEALHAIETMRYGEAGYFWINDSSPKMIMHPIKKSLIGKDLTNVQDPAGNYVYQDIVKVSKKEEGGTVSFVWDKPGSSSPQPKISYSKRFGPWDWIVSTGVYTDDIENELKILEEKTNEEIMNSIIKNIIITLVLIIVLILFIIYIVNKVIFKPLSKFEFGLLNFFKYLNKEDDTVSYLDDSSSDEIGKMSKVINENITKTKSLIEQDNELISDVTTVVEQVKEGYLSNRVEKQTQNESLQKLQVQLNEMLENLESNIGSNTNIILDVLSKYGELDFRNDIQNAKGKVEIAINNLAKIINDMLIENKENGLTLDSSSDILLENVDKLNQNSTTTAAALEETAAALEEITSTIINNTESISTMSAYSNELSESIKVGQELATGTVKAMDEINDQTEAIADAITVIDQIAFQTNILSLNAAVEAATAGEAGKGFAVVAQEVRNLASRSAEAAKEIKDLVESATLKTNAGKDGADKMIKGYASLNESISKTTEIINTITEASKEQRTGIEQINDAVTQLDQQTQQNVVISNTTHSIASQTDEIAKLIVSSANEKEFNGKETVKAKSLQTSSKSADEILSDLRASTQTKPKNNAIKQKQNLNTAIPTAKVTVQKPADNIIKDANTSKDDEWESF